MTPNTLSPQESRHILDTTFVFCYHIGVGQRESMPGKEVGHDKKRSLVMPMGVSLSGLPGSVTVSCLW
jgi:hypothetical protein